jgi:CXXX repeat peptide maturase
MIKKMQYKKINVVLSNKSSSFCHYKVRDNEEIEFIDIKLLKKIVDYAIERNLSLNFLYPEEKIPYNVDALINKCVHTKTIPISNWNNEGKADLILTSEDVDNIENIANKDGANITLRISVNQINGLSSIVDSILKKMDKVKIVFADIEKFVIDCISSYEKELGDIVGILTGYFRNGVSKEVNIITDRMSLKAMKNCMAGIEHFTAGLDGNFYICPAFYHESEMFHNPKIGSIEDEINIPENYLLKLEKSPICKLCDAYHCKRCFFLNKKMTEEINIPSEEQCVISHIERKATIKLMDELNNENGMLKCTSKIEELDYYDPFVKAVKYI